MIQTVDVFCRVVDNLGDAGVCWRLSRQLAQDHSLRVRLWIDRPETLAAFVLSGSEDEALIQQGLLDIRHLQDSFLENEPADLVIETFGCDVPNEYAQRMAQRAPQSYWVNLEYLSAEDWVEGCHALPSPHPRLPITRWFFFPGFTEKTGGLLRERGLLERRRSAQIQAVQKKSPSDQSHSIKVSIFCYDHPMVDALFDAFETYHQKTGIPTECRVFQGPAQRRAEHWISVHPSHATRFIFLDWMTQSDFDAVLWECDLNVVRGEDSFVRAQWSGRPFLWDIYPTEDDAHLVKMAAFLRRYREGWMETPAGKILGQLWQPWVRRESGGLAEAWMEVCSNFKTLTEHAEAWSDRLASQSDLTTALLGFLKTKQDEHQSK
jgi:uncharacterized repeat protein (TIGR03837 family)